MEYEENNIAQQNWNAEWESGFSPVMVEGSRPIYIRAEHHPSPDDDILDVVIAPRMSFGTGHHITTALMSRSIAEIGFSGKRGLDMGCGTGVLGIMAKKCGATDVVAVDIDDKSVANAHENAMANHTTLDIRLGSTPPDGPFDLILANIHRNILIQQMPAYARNLTANGQLWLSGFYAEDIPYIVSAAEEEALYLTHTHTRGEWQMLQFDKIKL